MRTQTFTANQTSPRSVEKPRTIAAKFAGICAETGNRYPVGTPIYKGANGWIAAQKAAQNTLTGTRGSTSAPYDYDDTQAQEMACERASAQTGFDAGAEARFYPEYD